MFVGNLFNALISFFFYSQVAPSGSYSGSKTVFGETVNAVVNFQDSSKLDFEVSGAFTLNCFGESYTMNANNVVLSNIGNVGDCAHDALVDNSVTLNGIAYDQASNQITVSVKYSIAKIDILLLPALVFVM